LRSTLQFNKEMLGEETVNKFIDQLAGECHEVFSHIILDTNWYPLDCLTDFTELLFNTILGKNKDTLKKGSKLIAEKQVTGIYKTLLTGGSIESFVKRINSINERYYQGVEVKTEYIDTNKLKVKYLGFEKKYHLHEIITMAWWEVVFENLGAKKVTTKITKSLLEGMDYFEFVITWEKTSP
ncbi:MAG: hypothetical protein ACOZBW_14325, partial [Thermodesulfobacteriota bacterium]